MFDGGTLKSNFPQAEVLGLEEIFFSSIGRKKRLPSCMLAVLSFGTTLNPRSMTEMEDIHPVRSLG